MKHVRGVSPAWGWGIGMLALACVSPAWAQLSVALPVAAKVIDETLRHAPMLAPHYPKSPQCSYASAEKKGYLLQEFVDERKLFQEAEAALVDTANFPPPPLKQTRKLCEKSQNRKACEAGFKSAWARGYQDGMSKMRPWIRNLSLEDGFSRSEKALDSELAEHAKNTPGFDARLAKSILTQGPCEAAAAIAEKAVSHLAPSDREPARAEILQLCYDGYRKGRERLRKIIGVSELGPEATPEAKGYLCRQDYERGRVVGAQMCLLFQREMRGETGSTQSEQFLVGASPASKQVCDMTTMKCSSTQLGEGAKTIEISACDPVPNTSCVPICYSLGIESTLQGKDPKTGQSICGAYDEYFKRGKVMPGFMRDPLASDAQSKPDSSGAGPAPGTKSSSEAGH